MTDLPTWVVATGSAALSGTGVLLAGWIKARVDNSRIRVDDRGQFTTQIMDRLAHVEQAALEERRFCEQRLTEQAAQFEARLASRDSIITELRERVTHLERLSNANN